MKIVRFLFFALLSFWLETTNAQVETISRIVCLIVGNFVGVTNNLDCECDFFVNLERGFGADVECFYENEFCFVGEPGNGICGTPLFIGSYSFRSASFTSVCFDEYGGPEFGFKDLCVRARHDPRDFTKIADCDVFYGDEPCDFCNVCDSGRDVTFDCSNLNFGTKAVPEDGPTSSECIGLGLF